MVTPIPYQMPGTGTAVLHMWWLQSPGQATASIADVAPATLPADTTAIAQAIATPIAPPTVLPVVHCPATLTITIAAKHPIGTPRIILGSYPPIVSRQASSVKVPSSQKVPLLGR